MKYTTIKRLMDLILSIVMGIVTSPILVLVSLIMKILDIHSPVLFTQYRVGKDNRNFKIYKFRTMKVETEKNGEKLSDSERLSKFGSILRRTSVDELPQLFNIIKGDMSFIGPRPLPPQYLEWYTADELRRHHARPGISGLAQVNGRNSISWDEKLKYDVEYVDSLSFYNDAKIFWKTLNKVLGQDDVIVRNNGDQGEIDFNVYRKQQRSQDVYK